MKEKFIEIEKDLEKLEFGFELTSEKGGRLHELCSDILVRFKSLNASYPVDDVGNVDVEELEKKEIEKVFRKLPKWAKKPEQINSRILMTYLAMAEEGNQNLTEEMLEEEYRKKYNDNKFQSNFSQMKSIFPKNHAKIFETSDGFVRIWEPVQSAVNDFKMLGK